MNYFAYQTAAERYARSRPYFHSLIVENIRETIGLAEPIKNALDVGCGTGQSTVALRGIARSVVGVDASAEMLSVAAAGEGITYLVSPAEQIPLPDDSFDLITVSLAFHWFDRPAFFREANRLLHSGGHLVIYNNSFYGVMRENPQFKEWLDSTFLVRYPTPKRNNIPVTDSEVTPYGFRFLQDQRYENEIPFTVEELAAYLTTQSNVIAAVEQGRETADGVYDWIMGHVAPLFPVPRCTFLFGGYIWYLQKNNA